MTPPATRITASDAPTAMPAMAPTLRPSSSESVSTFAGPVTKTLGELGGDGGGGDGAAPDPELTDAAAVTSVAVMDMASVDSMAATLVASDIAVAMVVLAVAALSASSYPMLMVSTTLPAFAVTSTFSLATPISRATLASMASSTVVVNDESSAAMVIVAAT